MTATPAMKSTFLVEAMDCPTEVSLIRKKLEPLGSVQKLDVDLMRREVVVHHAPDAKAEIAEALNGLGLGAREVLAASEPGAAAARAVAPARRWWRVHGPLAVAGAAAIGAEAVGWATGEERTVATGILAAIAILLAGRRPVVKAWIAIRNFTLSIDVLMTVAVTGAIFIGQWPEAAMVAFLFGVAEAIEGYSLERARDAISKLLELAPEEATVRRGEAWVEVPAAAVAVDDVMRVRAGERIPLDGEVVEGRSAVDQAPVTGESVPVDKAPGDRVYAGTVNQEGSLDVRVTAVAGESTVARIARAVAQAQGSKPAIERFVDRFSRVYTPIVVVCAALVAGVGPLVAGGDWYAWTYRALVLLVIACPCALVIATPVTVVSALTGAARRGILVKGGAYLEVAQQIRVVAVDKTGTITRGHPEVTDVHPLGAADRAAVLTMAGSLNAHSEHPIARAIRAAATGPLRTVTDFQNVVGRGVTGVVDGEMSFVGSPRLARERGVSDEALDGVLRRLESEGKSVSVVGVGARALGVIAVADAIKESSRTAIEDLHKLGVEVVMLTGDNARTAASVAKQSGIDRVEADLLPEDKLKAIERLAAGGPVAMVGDGVNDAPALAKSTLGIAMGKAGSDVAIETADVALMQDDLRSVAELLALGRRAMGILRWNIAFAIVTKAVFFVLAIAGIATLWLAVFADMGASLIVVLSGLRLLRHAGGTR